jgi:hypothetical protein
MPECPLTGEALPENDEEVAVVYRVAVPFDESSRACGHEITLQPLMDWLKLQKGAAPKCPACNKEFVISICDRLAAQSITQQQSMERQRCVALRFGAQNFYLAVASNALAQDRAAQVLDVKDLKILHSGKIVYPDKAKSADKVSETLLEISAKEISSHKRPTLIVMGAKTGRWGVHAGHLHK